jgi:ABC-type glycerol-3-phosphate transport system substrate-binding protein
MQVPVFYEHFRSGKMPLGVSNFATYIQMQVAAPELKGSWKIAPAPGITRNGVTERWEPGSAQVSMIFKSTKHPDEAWQFLKWWISTETQVHFANQLQTLYGKEYLWNTANNEAFSQLYWPEEDKQVVLEQWKWLKEVPKSPSAYLIERELSNIWTKVVFDGENIRSAVEDAVNEIDKETARKMEEFGYMKQGKVVAPYRIATIEDVESWVRGRDGN